MACSKGRIKPTGQTKLRLFSDAAGYCQNPSCQERLFSDITDKDYHIAEMAHIFAASNNGPRANPSMDNYELSLYENLILLCPNCHTKIDKNSELYDDETIGDWKRKHIESIQHIMRASKYSSRNDVVLFVNALLLKNRTVFNEYGPNNGYKENPEAETALVWKRKVLSQIIPNNQKIISTIDLNIIFFTNAEKVIIEKFRQHNDDLTHRHVGGISVTGITFPDDFNHIFIEGERL